MTSFINILKNFKLTIFILTTVVYFTTAYFSEGYFHADEHFQIIEFANSKIEPYKTNELAWEYKAQIRPSLQPTIAYLFLKALPNFGITNPYTQTSFLRFLTALLALISIRLFIRKTENQIENKKLQIPYHFLSYFLWFLPLVSCRFSSETWSGLFFLNALTIVITNKTKPLVLGCFLAISFFFRYQIAFSIVGLFCWLLYEQKYSWQYFVKIAISFIGIICLNIILDSWFYQQFVFVPWNYFYSNIVQGVASSFGTNPWYYYLIKMGFAPGFITGIPMVLCLIVITIYKPKNMFVWCLIPFLFFHSIIQHKEERFLFPILYLFPICMVLVYEIFQKKIKFKSTLLKYSFLFLFIISNLIGLVAMTQKAAGNGNASITKHLHNNTQNKPFQLIYCNKANPYNPWLVLPLKFYAEKNISERKIENICQFNSSFLKKEQTNYLVLRKEDLNNSTCQEKLAQNNFILVAQSTPNWIDYLNNKYIRFYKPLENTLLLYKQK